MPPCTTFSRNLANPFEKISPCVGLNEFLRVTPEEPSTSAPTIIPEVTNPEGLVATAEGMTISIFDRNTQRYVSGRPDCSHTKLVISPLTKELERIVRSNKQVSPTHVCLMCQKLFSGEKSRSDMEDHFEVSGHAITMCVDDMSFWCFECDCSLDRSESLNLNTFHSGVKKLKNAPAVEASPKIGVKRNLNSSDSFSDINIENLLRSQSIMSSSASDSGDSISSWDPSFNSDYFLNDPRQKKTFSVG
mmetsp:Transcript_1850/g.2463  ORF Transcript_1850/g.2463 Transcript_1850/m.2463 type:complete len:247 (+) Transcript_1850:232-972(+)